MWNEDERMIYKSNLRTELFNSRTFGFYISHGLLVAVGIGFGMFVFVGGLNCGLPLI